MKKLAIFCLVLAMVFLIGGCSSSNEQDAADQQNTETEGRPYIFKGVVLYIYDDAETMYVASVDDDGGFNENELYTVPMKYLANAPEPAIGDILEIQYDGYILETWPNQFSEIYSAAVTESADTVAIIGFVTAIDETTITVEYAETAYVLPISLLYDLWLGKEVDLDIGNSVEIICSAEIMETVYNISVVPSASSDFMLID